MWLQNFNILCIIIYGKRFPKLIEVMKLSSIKDVAKHAGVAISTVSKVLNGYPNVSDETKKKVNKSIDELHFVPNTIAATLSSKQAGRVALLININTKTQVIDEIAMQYICGAVNKANELKQDIVTLFFSMFEDKSFEEIVTYLKSQSVTGLIIYGISKESVILHQLIESQIFKIVLVDAPIYNSNTSSVWIDQKKAQYDVAKKTILENNCKRVLYIAGKKNAYVTEKRIEGIEELAKEMDLELTIEWGEFSELSARNITLKFAKNKDVVICASDLMAIGAMKALTEMDIFRPVCGFDGIMLMGYVGKQMNTVSQHFNDISSRAVTEMERLMSGETGRNVVLSYALEKIEYIDIIC